MPQVVVLNGGSSAGKSTLAQAFRDSRAEVGDFWLLIGIDTYLSRLPHEWYALDDNVGRFSQEGMMFRLTDSGAEIHFGTVGRRLLRAYQGGVAAAARAGIHVIVDELVFDQTQWDDWESSLAGLDAVWVGVQCEPDVAAAREAARGDRTPGKARSSALFAHTHARYDFTVDTTKATPEQALEALVTGLGVAR